MTEMNTLGIRHLEDYSRLCSKRLNPVLDQIREYTLKNCQDPQMMVGELEGHLLQLLITLTGAWNVLEIGTFTGYSTLCMAEAIGRNSVITSIDINPETSAAASQFINLAGLSDRVKLIVGNAREIIPSLSGSFDLVFIDADKTSYSDYFDLVFPKVRHGGLILFDNMLWSGRVLNPVSAEDHALHQLNQRLFNDSRVHNFLLPLRDGIQIVQKVART
jgi:caffeoyl-CoA O-methyltransferase